MPTPTKPVVPPRLAAAAITALGTPQDGWVIWNTDTDRLEVANGGAWGAVDSAGGGGVPTSRQIISGDGLIGGGDLSADRTLAIGAGTGIVVGLGDVGIDPASIDLDAWTSYTPTDSAIVVGNGTRVAKYQRVGRSITVTYYLLLGSSSEIQTSPAIGLPVTAVSGTWQVGSAIYQATGGANPDSIGNCFIDSGSSLVLATLACASATNSGRLSATAPFSWKGTDVLVANITYEAAS